MPIVRVDSRKNSPNLNKGAASGQKSTRQKSDTTLYPMPSTHHTILKYTYLKPHLALVFVLVYPPQQLSEPIFLQMTFPLRINLAEDPDEGGEETLMANQLKVEEHLLELGMGGVDDGAVNWEEAKSARLSCSFVMHRLGLQHHCERTAATCASIHVCMATIHRIATVHASPYTSLYITIHHYTSLYTTIHHRYTSPYITIHHYTSLYITIHHRYTSLHITLHHYT